MQFFLELFLTGNEVDFLIGTHLPAFCCYLKFYFVFFDFYLPNEGDYTCKFVEY